MIVVSDTSPLNYLALIGKADILHALFGEVLVPPAVANELQAEKTPAEVRIFMKTPPSWLIIRSPLALDSTLPPRLGRGEQEAISLAREMNAALLLCDDEKARKSATERALQVMGTLSLVRLAAGRGLLDFAGCIADLQKTTLRLSESLVTELLKEDTQRKQQGKS